MRRILLAICLLPVPAFAWEFRADPICTLSHVTDGAQVTITFDPGLPEYRLDLSLAGDEWAPADRFGMTFAGPRGLSIGTDRHRITGSTLTVTDRGFGNVLNGLEFNRSATAFTDSQSVEIALDGAEEPVRRFRRCARIAPATS